MQSDALVQTLLRFDRPAPRYTSYPPANHFHPLEPEHFAEALARAASAGADAPLAAYVHLPFCRRRCAYCGCHSLGNPGAEAAAAYLEDVAREIAAVAGRLGERRRVQQVQWGGGTPNYHGSAQLERCFRALSEAFAIAEDAEIGVELDPCYLTADQLDTLKALGFNRVSLGVQDLDPQVQRLIGRGQSEAQTREAYAACRARGFESVHFDLVYGLPGQTRESLDRTLAAVVELGPDRLSLFGFAYLPGLRPNQQKIPADTVPTAELRVHLYADAVARLTASGYERIGMDHFARPDDELAAAQREGRLHRNFQGYTTLPAEDLLAFGVSGISDVAGCYAQNEKELEGYRARTSTTGLATARGYVLDADDRVRREIVNSLMCNSTVRFAEIEAAYPEVAPFGETFGEELSRLQELQDEGFLFVDDEGVRLAEHAWPLVRLAAAAFDAYLHGKAPDADRHRYSTVV